MPKPPCENHEQGLARLVFCKKTIRADSHNTKHLNGNQHRKKHMKSVNGKP